MTFSRMKAAGSATAQRKQREASRWQLQPKDNCSAFPEGHRTSPETEIIRFPEIFFALKRKEHFVIKRTKLWSIGKNPQELDANPNVFSAQKTIVRKLKFFSDFFKKSAKNRLTKGFSSVILCKLTGGNTPKESESNLENDTEKKRAIR